MTRLALLLTLASQLFSACGGETTSGRQVALQTQVSADGDPAAEFVTPSGWTVRLAQAQLALAALYYFDGEPAFVHRDVRPTWQRLAMSPWLSVARAHPGHYAAGAALGQMTSPAFADLFAGTTALPEGTGVTGTYRSGRVALAVPTTEPGLSRLGAKVARVEGSARKGAQTVYFRISADLTDVSRSVRQGQVDGCAFDEVEVGADGAVTLRVKPHVWLNLVDFAGIAPGTPEAPTEIAQGETAQVAFALGVVQLSAYAFSYAPSTQKRVQEDPR